MGDAPRRPEFVPFPKSRATHLLMEDVVYDPPAYVWVLTIGGPTAIAAATCIALYGGAVRIGLGRRRAALLAGTAAGDQLAAFDQLPLVDPVHVWPLASAAKNRHVNGTAIRLPGKPDIAMFSRTTAIPKPVMTKTASTGMRR